MTPEPMTTPMQTFALSYAARGFHIFPCHDVTSGRCSCNMDCASPGKHPRTTNGLRAATTDATVIRHWWDQWPNANIGMDCGATGLTVVDVDVKRGAQGKASIRWFVDQYPAFSNTMIASSPSGGLHYYFIGTTGTTHSKMGPGLDVQSNGAYVLVPPSIAFANQERTQYGRYEWLNQNEILPYPVPQKQAEGYDFNAPSQSEHEGEARSAIPYGEHRDALLRVSWNLRRVLGLNVEAGTKIIQTMIDGGLLESYDSAHPFSKSDLAGMLRALPPIVASGPVASSLSEALETVDQVWEREVTERRVVIDGLVISGELHVFYGSDGTKKTTIMAYVLAQIAKTGRDVCVFISEDGPHEFTQKYLYGGGPRERLFVYSPTKFKGELLFPKHKVYLEGLIQERSWGAVYFDSINDYKEMGSRLNASDEARQLFGPLQQMAQSYDTTIICTLHTNARDVLEGSRQIRAKARVVARVENVKEIEPDADGYDFTDVTETSLASVLTTDKFSRGVSNTKHTFRCDVIPAYNMKTGAVEWEVKEDGSRDQKMLLVCVEHAKEVAAGKKSTGRPRIASTPELTEAVTRMILETPNVSANTVYRELGGNKQTIMRLVREAKESLKQ